MNPPPDDERTMLPFSDAAPTPPSAPPVEDSANNALPKGTRLGEFEITGLLGEGGFGIVYLAYDSSLERKVALKEYMPTSLASRSGEARVSIKSERCADTFQAGLRSFINEARMLAQFDDPSLVKVYRFWEANGTAYMVMPFYHGPTLKQALQAHTAPPDEAWLKELLRALLDALALIHQQQCFHRDIAPYNILLLDDGRPLLLDFGAARRAIGGMTQAFTVILKQGYAPIEQYADMPGMRQGPWTDLYALASVVHFAIDGRPPPPAVARILSDPYVPLASRFADRYSVRFLQAIDRALSVKPEDRPQDVAAMRALLALDEAPARRAAPPLPPSPEQMVPEPGPVAVSVPAMRGERRHLAIGAIAAAILAAAAALGYTLLGTGKAPAPATNTTASGTTVSSAPPGTVAAVAPPNSPPNTPPNVPPAPPPVTAPVDTAFSAISALGEVFRGASPDRTVEVVLAKSRVKIKRDQLRFTIRASHAGYVYLQMIDSNNYWLLFPNTIDQNNRIEAGQVLDLPRKAWYIQAEGPAGIDHLVAIVSDSPRDFSSAGLVKSGLFSSFPLPIAAQRHRNYTGATPLFAGTPRCAGGADCPPAYGATLFSIEEVER